MNKQELREMSRAALDALFEERRRELVEIRDEIDRRDSWVVKEGVNVDFSEYVKDWK